MISIKLLCNSFEIALRLGYSPVNLLHVLRTPFPRSTSGWLLLYVGYFVKIFRATIFRNTAEQLLFNIVLVKSIKCDALRDLVPFVQFKRREKHPWRSVNFSKVAGFSLQLY